MEKALQKKKVYLFFSVVLVMVLVAALAACTPAAPEAEEEKGAETEQAVQPVVTPDPDEYGVVTAESWKDAYPNEFASYQDNRQNSPSTKSSFLDLYPVINTLYKGMAFSKGYNQAASHLFSLESISGTPRVGDATLTNCLTCKTPQFTSLVNTNGDGEYANPFADLLPLMTEPISCFNCHENDPMSLTPQSQFFLGAIGSDRNDLPESAVVCGQCHNEYYFNPETKRTTNPYTNVLGMDPEAQLNYYNDIAFKDWVYPVTESPMLKVQHPEVETVYGGGTKGNMASLGYGCADCHMAKATAADGTEYTSHYWKSPLKNDELVKECNTCHGDLKADVEESQKVWKERITTIGDKIAELADTMTAQVEAGTLEGDKLAELQQLHRASQWYWDFVFVENSDGAHNPKMTATTLDKAEAAVDEALAML
ncbi:MAG: ammonia-forming cytochrome c nitrite reductase subunit c552 [Coriobacteriaceae bacterium]|jgi:nitrite reductase (cytochrome c-552)|nr:ammonia-forming cytochrome c nitrite reductase subunit c552 [Coriobacteriaceae bacterium]